MKVKQGMGSFLLWRVPMTDRDERRTRRMLRVGACDQSWDTPGITNEKTGATGNKTGRMMDSMARAVARARRASFAGACDRFWHKAKMAGRGLLACLLALALVPVVPGEFGVGGGALQEAWADDAPAAPAAAPQFTQHPADSTYAKGANARFYVRAASTDGGYLSYQWHRSRAYENPVANVATDSAVQDDIKKTGGDEPDGTSSVLTTTAPGDVAKTTYYYYWVSVTNHKDTNNDGDATDVGEATTSDSALAQVKVVNRTLFTSVLHGNFEYVSSYSADYSVEVYKPSDGYWDTTHLYNNKPKILEIGTRSNYGVGSTMMAELSSYNASSIYQEIATVPGKIYEWSLDHYGRVNAGQQVMAVIIGPAINEQSDYQNFAVTTNRWTVDSTKSTTAVSYLYPYGGNWDTYFADILRKLATDNNTTLSALQTLASGAYTYTVNYGSNTYYVQISSANQGELGRRSGVYTVPVGQGTTVFGFVPVTSASGSGNILDNITFASATGLDAEQEASFTGETSLSTSTKAGFAYALAEVRGSSVNELVGLSAFYNGAAIVPDGALGAGGWYTNGSTGFATGGTIIFKDLVPGKTYRIIGIPALAVNTGLHTNESPGNVLDNGYYKDVKIQAAYVGDASDLPSWDTEIYAADGGRKARVTLKNANSQVQYALLADDGSGEAPVTTGPALSGTVWKGSTGGAVAFEGLALASTYWLVSRPADYTEVTYLDAAWGTDGKLAAVQIDTPDADAVDLDPAYVSRAEGGTSITIASAGVLAGYEYVLADPASGHIQEPSSSNNLGTTFSSLKPEAAYQIVSRKTGGAWLKGVRVYPYPSPLAISYTAEAVGSSTGTAETVGFIPTTTEYRVRADDGTAAWLVGNAATWKRGTGTERLELAQAGVATGGESVFDALDTAKASRAKVFYRLAITDGYVGASVQPELSLTPPARPAAPSASAVNIDYANEYLSAGSAALEWRAAASLNYAPLASGASIDFEDLGWSAAVGQRVVLRYPTVAGSAFSSHESDDIVLKERPGAPEGLATNLVVTGSDQNIVINNLQNSLAYQYSRSVNGTRTWTNIPLGETEVTLPYDDAGDWDIRLAATSTAPASFYATVSTPLSASVLNLGSATFGDIKTGPHAITINNIVGEAITLPVNAVKLTGAGAEYFVLNSPGEVTVPAATSTETAWTITPQTNIPAGTYLIQIEITYSYNGRDDYGCKSNAYFTVNKANWDMSAIAASVAVGGITENGFVLSLTGGAPVGAQLSYQLGGGAFSTPPDAKVGAGGATAHSFSGLTAASSYEVRVRAELDANHNQSAAVVLCTVGTAQAKPNASAVVRVNYTNETLVFNTGYNAEDYLVTVAGSSAELASGASLSALATAAVGGNFTLQVVRRAAGLYPASVADALELAGRAAAPAIQDANTTPATNDTTADGVIPLSGSFQYRASRNGTDVTSGWSSASGSVNVTPGRYEVRRAPTASAFASAIAQVRVASKSPSVTVRTKTAVPVGGNGSSLVVPDYLSLPSGWTASSDPAHAGEYDHSYLSSPLALPAKEAVTSRSHVFTGWYDQNNVLVTSTPSESADSLSHYDYDAKWAVRPTVVSVEGVTPVVDTNTASLGLEEIAPVKLSVTLPAGISTLALSKILLAGQSETTLAALYSDSEFKMPVTDSLPLSWADESDYPVRAWLKTFSADDATPVYYELTLYTTRSVAAPVIEQTGGKGPGIKTTTSLSLTFEAPVVGFNADLITLTDGTGRAVKGALSGSGNSYTLAVSGVVQGTVNVAVADWAGYDVAGAAQSVEVYVDKTAPTGSISIQGNTFTEFLNTITFGLFFNETVDVTIGAKDTGGDGVARVEYLKVPAAFGSKAAVEAATEWQTYVSPLTVSPGEKFFVYAKFTDVAGNEAVVDSKGTVVYTNSAADTNEVSYTKLSGEDKTLSVQLNNNVIDAIMLGPELTGTVLTADVDYTVSEGGAGNVITLKSRYLETLPAGPAGTNSLEHEFTVRYKPLGIEYVDDGGTAVDGGTANQKPATTTFTVVAKKAEPAVELTVAPVLASGATYGDVLTLRAMLTDPGTGAFDKALPTGTVSFYKGTAEVPENLLGAVTVAEGGTGLRGRLDLDTKAPTLGADVYNFIAVYEGDENYRRVQPTGLIGYTVKQAAQEPLKVREGATEVAILGKPRDLEGGSFELSVEGGSGTGALGWTSSAPLVAEVVPVAGSNNTRATVTLHTAGNTTITVTKAGDSNHLAETVAVQLSVAEETTKPVPGGAADINPNSTLVATNLGETSLTLSWYTATDAFPPGHNDTLRYRVYRSTSNNISTLADCLANGGTPLNGFAGSENISSFPVTGLLPNTPHWFNVVVEDEAGNAAAYTSQRVVTPLKVRLTSATQYGGKNGRAASTGIWLVLDKTVEGFGSAHVDVTIGGTSTLQHGVISDGGDSNAATWLVTLAPFAGPNGTSASITVDGWSAPGGQSYFFEGDTVAGGSSALSDTFPLYAPVPQPTPTAAIDYVNERLTGLAPGVYVFANGSNGFGDERLIGNDGHFDLPYNLPVTSDTTLRIVQKGVAKDETPGDDDGGYIDSPPQSLSVPARPAAPTSFDVTPPAAIGGTGGLTGVVDTMEYRSATAAAGTSWEPVKSGQDTVTGLAPGVYYLRLKAVANTSFASETATCYIHAYNSVSFKDTLEGYKLGSESGQVQAKTVQLDDYTGVESVVWEDSSAAAGKFTLEKNDEANVWTVQPTEGLATGTYKAKLKIQYTGDAPNVAVQDVSFTVQPKAELTSVVVSSTAGTGGKTDTLVLSFKYPINLEWDSLVVGGAARKLGNAFLDENNKKEYRIALSPLDASHTGDAIEVTVNLGSEYEFQKNTTGVTALQNNTQTVVIPREIASAEMIPVPAGWSPFILQFTFAKTGTITDPSQLEWYPTEENNGIYNGPIKLTGAAAVGTTITGVYRVDTDMGWTYRLTLNIGANGPLRIGIPAWNVLDVAVGDIVLGSKNPKGAAFILDGEGHNYLTDLQSRQELPEADARGGYVAPAYALPTNVELNDDVSEVYIDGVPYVAGSGLWRVTGAGPKPYIFDGVAQADLNNQLVLTLNEDWTREASAHEIIVVFGDNTVARAIITVKDITKTWPLTLRGSEGALGFGGVTGGEGVVAGAYGTDDDCFVAGSTVEVTAAEAETGWRFDRWEQTSAGTAIELPQGSLGTITMPAAALELTARYTDGVAPVSTLVLGSSGGSSGPGGVADGAWTRTGELVLAATDADVRNKPGGVGTVASVTYKVDDKDAVTVTGAEANIALSAIADLRDGQHAITYWATDAAGNVGAAQTATVGYDTTVPSGLIRLRGLEFNTFIGTPQFVRFYRGDVLVEFGGADGTNGSGVAHVRYLVRNRGTAFNTEASALAADGWTESNGFSRNTDGAFIIYARITDNAGNEHVVATDGVVRYTDANLTTPPVTFTKTSTTGVNAGLALHGNTVAGVKGGEGPLTPSVAYNVAGETLTFAAAYLNSLPVPTEGGYSFTVQLNPQGLTYVADGSVEGTGGGNGSGNNAPTEIVIPLAMAKVTSVLGFSAEPEGGAVYGNSTRLTATVPPGGNGTHATGEVQFFNGATPLGNGPVTLGASGVATLSVGLDAGTHELCAKYGGDGNFLADDSDVVSYNVDKAAQAAVGIERVSGIPIGALFSVDYGDESFALHATGGSGKGVYEWSSDNTAVAAVDKTTGTVTVVAVGSTVISVRKLGDDNYNTSATTSFVLRVEPRPVRILSVAVADKVYDKNDSATFASVPVLENVALGDEQAISVSLANATARFESTDAGQDKTVLVGGFTLSGAKIDSYELQSAPSTAIATIKQALPDWDGAGPAASGGSSNDGKLFYGQRLSALTLVGAARGVGGEALSGSLEWAPSVSTATIPGSDAESATGGLAASYPYGVVFTPTGSFATNYRALEGTVAVVVQQAEPEMAGRVNASTPGSPPVGSPIFASDSGRLTLETLANSTITGDVVFTYGGVDEAVEGEWSWDKNDAATAYALANGYAGIGMRHPHALFTPKDLRIAPLFTEANVPVYSPRSEITVEPTIGAVTYGGKVSDATIGSNGQVVAVAANDYEPNDYDDITALGTWSWKNPDALITSKTSKQTAVLVFTPSAGNLAELTQSSPTGYLAVEKTVTLTVKPVTPVFVSVTDVPAITLGQALSSSDVSASSYTFGGLVLMGDGVLSGSFAWENTSIVPGSAGHEDDGWGSTVRESGRFKARAIFTPDAALYGDAYAPVPVDVPLVVAASKTTQQELNIRYSNLYAGVLFKVLATPANYRATDIAAFEAALDAARELLDAPTASEAVFERKQNTLVDAANALVHDHPIVQQSPPVGTLADLDDTVSVEMKGELESVTLVSLNGTELDITPTADPDEHMLLLPSAQGGTTVGSLSQGAGGTSVVVELLPEFTNTLAQSEHSIALRFVDDYASSGLVEARFTIAYSDNVVPSGAIQLRGLSFDTFIAAPQPVRFYRGDVAVTLDAADTGGSGVARVEYLVLRDSDAPFATEAEAAATITGWTSGRAFSLNTDGRFVIYLRVTDRAGNMSVVATDGIVRYTDSTLTAPPPIFTKTSVAGVSAELALAGNTVVSVEHGNDVLVAGTDYSIAGNGTAGGALTFNPSYLNAAALEKGDYSFTVLVAPQGVAYVANGSAGPAGGGAGDGNDEPMPLNIPLTINRAEPVLTLSAAPTGSAVYGGDVELTGTVAPGADGTVATGEMRFYDGSTPLGTGAVALVAGTATLTVASLGGGEHDLRAEYSGDGNFNTGSDTLEGYNIEKAAQDAVNIVDAQGVALAGPLAKTYGEAAFTLQASGGSGTGAFEWLSDNAAVARVDAVTGEVTVVAAGSARISVRRAGDDNYNVSSAASLVLDVERRTVRVLSIAIEDKDFDKTDVAAFASMPAPVLDNVVPGDSEQDVRVALAGASAHFASASAGVNKSVLVSGLGLEGDKASSYVLQSTSVQATATINKALPSWDTGAPAASGLVYGQRLAASSLSQTAVALDVKGQPLLGTLEWAPLVDVTVIPGNDPVSAVDGLAAGGYEYAVVFTPNDTSNYLEREGTVAVAVAPVVPIVAGGTGGASAAPVGSSIFASDSPRPETLADSAITGDAVFTLGGIETAIVGTWSWDDAANGAAPEDIGYTNAQAGLNHPWALFMPSDPRIAPLSIAADLAVYSPRSEIHAEPTIATVPYGATVGDALIGASVPGGSNGQVFAVAADDVDPGDYVDITALGAWGWKNPNSLITSTNGTQAAVLVFTPGSSVLADLTAPSPEGYLPVEAAIELEVEPVLPVLVSLTGVPAITLDEPLSACDLSASSAVFGGVADFGDGVLSGSFVWDEPSLVPGSAGYEGDGLGGTVSESGKFLASATFTPDAARYGAAYAPVTVNVMLVVAARVEIQEDLSAQYDELHDVVLPAAMAARENYRATDIVALEDALAVARALLDAGNGSELACEQALAALEEARTALVHDHPILRHSARDPIVQTGSVGVTVEIKGTYESAALVSLNGVELVMAPLAAAEARALSLPASAGATAVGSLSKGSVIVSLSPEFVDSLENGTHVIRVVFADDYARGQQEAQFVIARPEDGGDGDGDGDGGGSAGGADADVDKNKDGSGDDGDDTSGAGDDKAGGSIDTGKGFAPASDDKKLPIILIALAGVIVLLAGGAAFLFAFAKRRARSKDDS
jgi:hypothetical protein